MSRTRTRQATCGTGHPPVKWQRWSWLGALAVSLPGPLTAAAAQGQAPAEGVRITVRDTQAQGQLIRVPVNKSVIVDFSQPVREVRVAKPEFAEVAAISPQQIILTGKAFGTTQLIAWVGDTQRVFDVAVDLELDRMLASLRTAVPRGKIQAHALLDSVVLTGTVPDAQAAEQVVQIASVFSPKVINHLRVAGVQQVLLRVTVAEINRSAERQLGFNGWLAGDDFRDFFFLSNLDQINPSNMGAPEGALVTGTIPFLVGEDGIPVTGRTTVSFGFPRVQLQVFVQALRENGLLRVLAEPVLVAISGQQASFLAGGEIPIPIVTDERIRIDFKEFGIRLNFTPALISEEKIRLHVSPEISEPDFTNAITVSGSIVPSFTTRRVQTTVELGTGQTFAIGGLLSDRVRAIARGVPGLGDVPVLGALFRSVDYQQERSELLVLVTPELVEPVSTDQITHVPGAEYIAPNDFELFLMGQLDGASGEQQLALQPRVNHTWPVRPQELYGSAAPRLRGPVGPTGGTEGQ